jgi:predicted  nucleic acid-binding Zn-ribbon protein
LEALKHEIEERNNEIMIARKEVQDYNNRVMRLEKEKRDLETRLIDKKARPPREMKEESQNQGFLDEIMKLKDENQNLQDVNMAYQKEINVKITNKLEDIKREKIQMEDRLRVALEKIKSKELIIEMHQRTQD